VGKRAGPFPCEIQADLLAVHVLDGGGVRGERAGEETAKRRGAEVAERGAEFFGLRNMPKISGLPEIHSPPFPLSVYLCVLRISAFRFYRNPQGNRESNRRHIRSAICR